MRMKVPGGAIEELTVEQLRRRGGDALDLYSVEVTSPSGEVRWVPGTRYAETRVVINDDATVSLG